MNYKDFFSHIREANLTGKSRSAGVSNWKRYVVRDFNPKKKYIIEKNTTLYDENFNEKLSKVSKGDTVNILSIDLKKKGRSKFAKVNHNPSKQIGYININSIRKPTTKSGIGVIPGGTNSKEFTPDKLNVEGVKFTSSSSLISTVVKSIKSIYGDDKYTNVRKYLYECMSSITGTSINESFSKTYSLDEDYNIVGSDVKILSKNFGEVLAALYIVERNKNVKYVEFPADVSQGLYDFIAVDKKDITDYYSVKSHGGSSTSMENLNYILKNFSKDNVLFKKNRREVEAILSLMNNKKEGVSTLNNIENFFKDNLKDKQSKIVSKLSKISSYRLRDLSQKELDKWFPSMISQTSEDEFVETMQSVYEDVFGNRGRTPKTTEGVLRQIYKSGNGSKYHHGYLYYPMGSYIVNYMNNDEDFINILNVILNYGSYIHEFNVDMMPTNFTVNIQSFKKKKFRFSYNAGSKYPANRPIGFKKTS